MNSILKRAFTLIEVNLAIFIMAGGVLAMISLYSLGFRESRQSREDVASAALADLVLNPLVVALSSKDLKWSEWQQLPFKSLNSGTASGDGSGARIQVLPDKGWLAYFDTKGSKSNRVYYVPAEEGDTTPVPVPPEYAYEISGTNTDGFFVTVTLG